MPKSNIYLKFVFVRRNSNLKKKRHSPLALFQCLVCQIDWIRLVCLIFIYQTICANFGFWIRIWKFWKLAKLILVLSLFYLGILNQKFKFDKIYPCRSLKLLGGVHLDVFDTIDVCGLCYCWFFLTILRSQ